MQNQDHITNILPRSIENIKAVLLHYFPNRPHSEIEEYALKLLDEREFQLNEIFEVAKKVNENMDYLRTQLQDERLTISNCFTYGADAVLEHRHLAGSKNRILINNGLKESIRNNSN